MPNCSVKDLDGRFFEYFSTVQQHGSGPMGGASFEGDMVDGYSTNSQVQCMSNTPISHFQVSDKVQVPAMSGFLSSSFCEKDRYPFGIYVKN